MTRWGDISIYFILFPFYKPSALITYLPAHGNTLLQGSYVILSMPFHTGKQHIRYYNLNLISINKLLLLRGKKSLEQNLQIPLS